MTFREHFPEFRIETRAVIEKMMFELGSDSNQLNVELALLDLLTFAGNATCNALEVCYSPADLIHRINHYYPEYIGDAIKRLMITSQVVYGMLHVFYDTYVRGNRCNCGKDECQKCAFDSHELSSFNNCSCNESHCALCNLRIHYDMTGQKQVEWHDMIIGGEIGERFMNTVCYDTTASKITAYIIGRFDVPKEYVQYVYVYHPGILAQDHKLERFRRFIR